MKVFTWKQRIIVVSVTVAVIGVFALLGYAVGSLVGNWKLGIALGALISYPFTQFTLVRAMRRVYKVENPDVPTNTL